MMSANNTLQNVFVACEKKPNTIPFDKIVLRRKADTKSACICKYITIIIILALIFVPLFAIQKKADVETELGTSSIHLTLEDNNYFFPSCYSINTEGLQDFAIKDPAYSNQLVFPYIGMNLHLYLCDEYGEYLHLIISPNK